MAIDFVTIKHRPFVKLGDVSRFYDPRSYFIAVASGVTRVGVTRGGN